MPTELQELKDEFTAKTKYVFELSKVGLSANELCKLFELWSIMLDRELARKSVEDSKKIYEFIDRCRTDCREELIEGEVFISLEDMKDVLKKVKLIKYNNLTS